MDLLLELSEETASSTLSKLYDATNGKKKFLCWIIEDDYDEVKTWGETRIPGGRYEIIKRTIGRFARLYKQRYGHKYSLELKDVPNYVAILIHIGNTISDTHGCLLPNMKAVYDRGHDRFSGEQSTKAFLYLYNHIAAALDSGERVFITIKR